MLCIQQVDKGAIKFILSGANIMCPGLTSKGAKMQDAPKDTIVVGRKYHKSSGYTFGMTNNETQNINKFLN